MRRFEDRVVLITGAASGIGRATALRLADEGARTFCLDLQAEALADTARQVGERGSEAQARECDVSRPDQVASAVAACLQRFGRLDVLCNMAGILRMGHFEELDVSTWERILAVNLTGTFLMCQAALPPLLASQGNIVNAASSASLAGLPYGVAYSASKGGISALTRSLAVEYGRRGLRVNAVCPGSILTPMTASPNLPADADARLVQRQMALDRPRGPETVAALIAFLASDEAAHVNGEEIRVDGGTLA